MENADDGLPWTTDDATDDDEGTSSNDDTNASAVGKGKTTVLAYTQPSEASSPVFNLQDTDYTETRNTV